MKKLMMLGIVLLMLSMMACQSAPVATAGEPVSTAELRNTLWKLTVLNGMQIQTQEGRRMASLTLTSEGSQSRLETACNRGSAGYVIDGKKLKFEIAMSTKMMCPPTQMQEEAAFFKVIAETASYDIKGETLELYDADNVLLASFHSEYLK